MLTDGITDFISFLFAVGVGAVLCLIYDFFRILRIGFRSKTATVLVQDLLFALLAALITFSLLLLRCNGRLRMYVFAGELFGFLFCRFTVSRILMFVSGGVIRVVKRFINWLKKSVIMPIFTFFSRLVSRFLKMFDNVLKKVTDLSKKALQPIKGLLYNVNDKRTTEENISE